MQHWIPVWPDEAVRGSVYCGFKIIQIAREETFRQYDGQCKVIPGRLLPMGSYRYVLIDTEHKDNEF